VVTVFLLAYGITVTISTANQETGRRLDVATKRRQWCQFATICAVFGFLLRKEARVFKAPEGDGAFAPSSIRENEMSRAAM
jgi:hypothetical protein